MALWSTHPLTEMSAKNISWRVQGPVRWVDKIATFMYRLSCNLCGSAAWNSQGIYTPVQNTLDLHSITLSSLYLQLSSASQLKSQNSITGHSLWGMCRVFLHEFWFPPVNFATRVFRSHI